VAAGLLVGSLVWMVALYWLFSVVGSGAAGFD
jgi:hypothetical protein